MKNLVYNFFFKPDVLLKRIYYRSVRLNQLPWFFSYLREIPRKSIERKFGCYISPKSNIHRSVSFPHPVGVVIGDGVVVGANCVIYQGVTLGAARKGEGSKGLYPKLGDSVVIYSGAVIVGDVQIGSGATVGANSVVLNDVPDGAVVAGVPARIVRKK